MNFIFFLYIFATSIKEKNKLEGKLENCGKKTKEKSIYDLIKMIPQNGGSTTDNFNSIMHWEDAVW